MRTNTSQTCIEFEPFFNSPITHRHGPERWPLARSFPSISQTMTNDWFSIFFSCNFLSFYQIYAICTRCLCHCYQLILCVISHSVWMVINILELLRFVCNHWKKWRRDIFKCTWSVTNSSFLGPTWSDVHEANHDSPSVFLGLTATLLGIQ